MPALSQNLEFVVNGTTSTSVVYPLNTTTAQTYVSTPVKAANYYGLNNSLQTVEVRVTDFIGTVTVQATLASAPVEADWFAVNLTTQGYSVDTTGLITHARKTQLQYGLDYPDYGLRTEIYNFEGNYIWFRAKLTAFTAGTLNGIKVNY